MAALQHPKGTFDVLPADSGRWETVLATFAATVERAGYGLIITPTFEDINVFKRIGDSTDVVRKEMYDFVDKGERHVALRPEQTASVVRAFIQHKPPLPWKVWYAGSQFRYERAQAGRYREFHQVGIEAFGSGDADLDVEVIALGWEFYRALGIEEVDLMVNSLGDGRCRPAYRAQLLDYLSVRRGDLCPEHEERLSENPLRVLDCKKPECQAVVVGAPLQVDHLCQDCRAHFERVRNGLDALGITYRVNPVLVRGLDYYTRTAFEYAGTALAAAQNALGGGGRYDGLVSAMGGPDTPAVGFALGVERILLALDAAGASGSPAARLDAFVIDSTGGEAARDITGRLRAAGLRADRAFDSRSFKSQFKAADRSGAQLALVVGPDELAAGTVSVKDLVAGGEQTAVALEDVVAEVRRRIGSGS
jgi:histidyl-tRNA synthetase